jgi:hypothetical protein
MTATYTKLIGLTILSCVIVTICSMAQISPLMIQNVEAINVKVEEVTFKGKKAVRVIATSPNAESLAILKDVKFENGIITLQVAGQTLPGASATARGFIGLAFRVRVADSVRYECFYIRPTNGRADDQLRRNHSTQYISHPRYTWFKLRNENPGVYESYTDLVEGEWTQLKIEVHDDKARLFVNGASQPCLIVNDLKMGKSAGGIALWVGPGTDGYFADISIK